MSGASKQEETQFRAIVADPPWKYRDKVNSETMNHVHRFGYGADKIRGRRGAEGYYPTMTIDEIVALPIKGMAQPDAHLYLWTTNAFMVEGHQVCKAWGFTPRTILTWAKGRLVNNRLSLQIGMGSFLRNVTEHVIFAVRGTLRCKVKNVPTLLLAPRTKHSEKPDAFYELVERCTDGPYLELFARRKRNGWKSWGNEIESDLNLNCRPQEQVAPSLSDRPDSRPHGQEPHASGSEESAGKAPEAPQSPLA